MIKIKKFAKTKLTQEEFYLLCLMICQKIRTIGADKLGVPTEVDHLESDVKDMENSLYKLPKGIYNKRRIAMQKEMREFNKRFFAYIRSFSSNRDKAKVKAVGTLTPIMTAYEDIGLQLMDMLINNNDKLVESFRADNLKAEIELLELDDRLDAIVEMNNKGKELQRKQLKNNVLHQRIRQTAIVRREMSADYDKLTERLNRLALLYGSDDYTELFNWWNEKIDHYRVEIVTRKTVLADDLSE